VWFLPLVDLVALRLLWWLLDFLEKFGGLAGNLVPKNPAISTSDPLSHLNILMASQYLSIFSITTNKHALQRFYYKAASFDPKVASSSGRGTKI
jgi:hypothetical protein